MASRARSVAAGSRPGRGPSRWLFLVTVWVLLAVLEDGIGCRAGARIAVVEIEGIILDGDQAVRELREHAEKRCGEGGGGSGQ